MIFMKKIKRSYSATLEKSLDKGLKSLGLKVTGKQLLANTDMRDIMHRMIETEITAIKK